MTRDWPVERGLIQAPSNLASTLFNDFIIKGEIPEAVTVIKYASSRSMHPPRKIYITRPFQEHC